MSDNNTILEQYFGYIPSIPLAVIATIFYFLVSLPLFYQSYRHHNKLTYVLPITGLVETVGYIIRLYMIDHASLNVYVLMGLLIILAPNALAFANYKVLGKIIHTKAVHLRLPSVVGKSASDGPQLTKLRFHIPYLMSENGEVHGNRLAGFFFLSDVAAIFLQGAGGGMQGSGNPDLGTDVLLFGLASQLFFFAIFAALAIYVYSSPLYLELESPVDALAAQDSNLITPREYDRAFFGLFSTIGMLFVRNIYRVIEFSMGYKGYLAVTEAFMYVFDTLFIFVAFLLYIYYNFAGFLSKADKQVQSEEAALAACGAVGPADGVRRETVERSESEEKVSANHVIMVKMVDSNNDMHPISSGGALV